MLSWWIYTFSGYKTFNCHTYNMVGRENQKSFLCTRLHLKKPFVFLLCCSRKKTFVFLQTEKRTLLVNTRIKMGSGFGNGIYISHIGYLACPFSGQYTLFYLKWINNSQIPAIGLNNTYEVTSKNRQKSNFCSSKTSQLSHQVWSQDCLNQARAKLATDVKLTGL